MSIPWKARWLEQILLELQCKECSMHIRGSPGKGLIVSRDALWLFRPKQTRLHRASLTRLATLSLLFSVDLSTYGPALPTTLSHLTYYLPLLQLLFSLSSNVQSPKKSPDSNRLPVILSSYTDSRHPPRIFPLLHIPCPLLSVTRTMASL